MIFLVFLKTWFVMLLIAAGALLIEHAAFGWFGWFLLAAPVTVLVFLALTGAMFADWRTGRANGEYRYLIVRDRD